MKNIVNKKHSAAINYEGKVTVSISNKKKTLKTKTYHNAGKWPLFNFLAICVGGDYDIAETYRPKFLRLLHIEDISSITFDNKKSILDSLVNTTPSIKIIKETDESGTVESATVTLKFLVPFTQLASYDGINLLALYCANTKLSGDPCCYFIITDDDGNLSELIDTSELQKPDDYAINIQWDMTFKNK